MQRHPSYICGLKDNIGIGVFMLSRSVMSDSVTRQSPLSLGILQARILEWVAFPFFSGSFQPRDQTHVSLIAGGFFNDWATREAAIPASKSLFPS